MKVQLVAGASAPGGHAAWVCVFGANRYEIVSTQVSHLLTAGGAARIEGACEINGVGGFNFTVIVVPTDGQDGSETQRLRLQVRDATTATVVLDTQPGSALEADLGSANQVENGRVTIGSARD